MIDTVIFDIGNVLTEWHWHNSFVEWFGEDLVDTLANATVMSPEWAEIDRGVLTEEEVVALLTKNAPDYPEQIRRSRQPRACHRVPLRGGLGARFEKERLQGLHTFKLQRIRL